MATRIVDFSSVDPYVPTLFHLATVKIAIPLFNDLDVKATGRVLKEIRHRDPARFNKSIQKNCKTNRAKETLLLIPPHLRLDVLRAVMGMHHAASDWQFEQSEMIDLRDKECSFYWRYDGLIDGIETARQLVLDANFHIRERFDLACKYCLVKSVVSLWAEMDKIDKSRYLETDDNCVMHFWVTWLRGGRRIPWLQAMRNHFYLRKVITGVAVPNLTSFFPLLQPRERWHFIPSFIWASEAEIRLCLQVLNQDERRYFLYKCSMRVLAMYLEWPLQSFFLEKAEKLFHVLKGFEFNCLLHKIWLYHEHWEKQDFDYYKLFLDFWNAAPQHFRECAKEDTLLKKDLKSCFNKMRQKRKMSESSDTNPNKMMKN